MLRCPPILLLAFNRPELVSALVEKLRVAQPERVYVSLDGPRAAKLGEAEVCEAVQRVVREGIDWPCDLKVQASATNQGCKLAVARGIQWFFQNEEAGIILEDDCHPHPDFFSLASRLLEHYKDDSRVGMIGGVNFQHGQLRGEASYYFTKYPHIWGWASWARAWRHYDLEMAGLEEFLASPTWSRIHPNAAESSFWKHLLREAQAGRIDTWDYQWAYALWRSGAVTALAQKNLIANLGFGGDATRTTEEGSLLANMPTEALGEWRFADDVSLNHDADSYTFETTFQAGKSKKVSAEEKAHRKVVKTIESKLESAVQREQSLRKCWSWKLAKPFVRLEQKLRGL